MTAACEATVLAARRGLLRTPAPPVTERQRLGILPSTAPARTTRTGNALLTTSFVAGRRACRSGSMPWCANSTGLGDETVQDARHLRRLRRQQDRGHPHAAPPARRRAPAPAFSDADLDRELGRHWDAADAGLLERVCEPNHKRPVEDDIHYRWLRREFPARERRRSRSNRLAVASYYKMRRKGTLDLRLCAWQHVTVAGRDATLGAALIAAPDWNTEHAPAQRRKIAATAAAQLLGAQEGRSTPSP